MEPASSSAIGREVRYWRRRRGFSQLALALQIGMSPRQLSFIETGRARPRQETLLRLADVLEVPIRDRNQLLAAAGLPAAYPEQPLPQTELLPIEQDVEQLIRAHQPYPAWVCDRTWNVRAANRPAMALFPDGIGPSVNLIDAVFGPWRELIENWHEVAAHTLMYIRRESRETEIEPRLARVLAEAERTIGARPPGPDPADDELAIRPRLKIGGQVLETIATVARLGTSHDPMIRDLRVYLLFPVDAATAVRFQRLNTALKAKDETPNDQS
jgi:transcriptional regulator with XRE-family HTH domain